MNDVVKAAQISRVPVVGGGRFPVHRIYCVGRNYKLHVEEMGGDAKRDPPLFFSKPADAVVCSQDDVPYPPRCQDFHHEVELVVALGSGGSNIAIEDAHRHVYGFAVGNDLTRRDWQGLAKKGGQPWDVAKGFDASAALGDLSPAAETGPMASGRISLKVNGEVRQQGDLAEMIWSVPEIIAELSTLYALRAGDLIFTGTPAGVGAMAVGDVIDGGIEGLPPLHHRIGLAR